MIGIATRAEDSVLLRRLLRALPMIHARLGDAGAWRGIHVQEPELDETYRRLVCRDDLAAGTTVLGVAVHLFAQPGYAGRMHDHRWPIAVYPLDLHGRRGEPLYDMPYEIRDSRERGELVVRSGQPWAIERCTEVLHTVRGRCGHLSIVVSDTTAPAARENRMITAPLADPEVADLLARARELLGAELERRAGC